SRMVLPSMRKAMPASAVIVVGYWPPLASQWPSRCWTLARYSRPFWITSRYLGASSSAGEGRAVYVIKAKAKIGIVQAGFMSSVLCVGARPLANAMFPSMLSRPSAIAENSPCDLGPRKHGTRSEVPGSPHWGLEDSVPATDRRSWFLAFGVAPGLLG